MNLTVSFFVCERLLETKRVATPCTIGRSSRANWVLTHPMLSRNHCILFDKEEELYLCDNGSLNGTHYKGAPVKESVRLQLGDEFTVGHDLKFRVSVPGESEPAPDRTEHIDQTTVVHSQDDLASQQSTVLSEEI